MKAIEKPIYQVPSMREVEAILPNGFNVVSTFSGAGGSCLGYRMAGFKVLWANEFIPAAQDVYKLNHPNSILDTRDIRQIQASEILDAIGLKQGEIDILDGSPPCASFSTAGKREKGWGKAKKYSDTVQRVDDLFFEYARLLKDLQPKVFVAENVSGLVKGTAKGYFLEILKSLKDCGYNVKAKLLDAQWLGVPQARQRIIFIGVRNDLNLEPIHPTPLNYRYSVKDALRWITKIIQTEVYKEGERITKDAPSPATVIAGLGAKRIKKHFVESIIGIEGGNGYNNHEYYEPNQPIATIQASRPLNDYIQRTAKTEHDTSIERFAIGAEWDKLKQGEKGKFFSLVKPELNKPCPTITAEAGNTSKASVTHPTEKRKFSIAELKRICAFPDDFILTGTYAQQWERLGRSVPPVMMFHIAKTIEQEILCQI